MDDDRPKLRLVDPDEVAPEPDPTAVVEPEPTPSAPAPALEPDEDRRIAWVSTILPLCIGVAILAVGLAFALRLLMDPTSDEVTSDDPEVTSDAPATPLSTIDPRDLIPTIAPPSTEPGASTAPAAPATAPTAPVTAAPTTESASLVPLPVIGGAAAAPVTSPPAPTTGAASVRFFNGWAPGVPLAVWDMTVSPPRQIGSVPYAGLAELVIGGRLLPSGVEVRLRFVAPGTDPTTKDPSRGPWDWNFTPANGSSQSMMISNNGGFHVLRIDNRRALGEVQPGRVHVVPVAAHLRIEGSAEKEWSADGFGCLGHRTTDNTEFDVDVGTPLRLTSAGDLTCARGVSDAVVVNRSTAMAVIGIATSSDHAQLIAVPLD